MPIAAPTMASQVHGLPVLPDKGSASGKADAQRPEFGKLFREQTGPIQPSVSAEGATAGKAASAVAEGEGTSDPTASAEPRTTGLLDQPEALPIEADSRTAALPGSLKSLLHAQLQSLLHAGPASHDGATHIDCSASDPDLSVSAEKPSEVSGKSTDPASSLSAKALQSPNKPKKPGDGDQQNVKMAAPLPVPEQSPMSVTLPAASVPPVLQPAPEQIAVLMQGKSQPTAAPVTPDKGGKAVPSQRVGAASTPLVLRSGTDAGSQAVPSNLQPEPLVGSSEKTVATSSDSVSSSNAFSSGAPRADSSTPKKVAAGAAIATASFGSPPPHLGDAAVSTGATPSVAATAGVSGNDSPNLSNLPNPYDRIDQGSALVVLHSGAQHMAVGVHDPDLGWVEIQTQNTAGHLDALLVTASGQTHASLAAQLPAMAQYLEQRDVRVGTLIVHHETSGGGFTGGSGANYGSGNSGANAQHSGSGNPGGENGSSRYTGISPARLRAGPGIEAGIRVGDEGPTLRPLSYISVRA
ncbi:MAG: hypothetical protein WAM66_11320 [Acidobacteriaceae bacterium]